VERKAGGFASFAERTVFRDWKQSTWGLISKFEKKFWIWERRMLNVEMVNWLNLDGPTIYNVSKRNSAFMQCGCALLNPPASKKLNPAGQSLFCPVLYCVVGMTPSEHNSSSNFRRFDDESQEWLNIWMYIFQRRCFQREEWYVEKLFISHFSGSPDTYLYDRKYVLSMFDLQEVKYFCMISDTSAWSTYIIRILVPTLRYIVFRCDT